MRTVNGSGQGEQAALYVITVDGELDPDWSPRLGGLQITTMQSNGLPISHLTGWLEDQSALHGVLTALHGLSLPLLSVERVRTGQDAG